VTTYHVEGNAPETEFRRFFRLDEDLATIRAEILQRGPELAEVMASQNGLRILHCGDPAEELFSFLCTPNNHLKRIIPMVEKLAAYGESMGDDPEGRPAYLFPGPARIAEIPEEELRAQGFGYRGRTIPQVARQLMERGSERYLKQLKAGTYQEAFEELTSLYGVGPKLADCIALFALGFTQAVPIDTHLRQALTRLYHPELADKPLTDLRYRQLSGTFRQRFGDKAAWAHQCLFYDNLLHWRERKEKAPVSSKKE
jgi:8-oxoguanine DNA-glycosylase Ogg